eukprot:CAMPEP_0119155028 /NCGR_PEP_ID=MMETSP1310-20130426/51538_1 /TAXON_ID=464262 /ORGANISM="Genus nov. species nov., Strain RCC2339" /LENGTH=242 /DNA_ID=CAMNT_0007147615 /DNA_START=299 /DNA_END=1024 /DNA_ORIENTATION=-
MRGTTFFILFLYFRFAARCRTLGRSTSLEKLHNEHCNSRLPIPTFHHRNELGNILEEEHFLTGAEVGVQQGIFAERTLRTWPSCKKYVLIDLWMHQEHYRDSANVPQDEHTARKQQTLERLSPFVEAGIIQVCQNFSTTCAKRFPDSFFDYIYIDARHDYLGVKEDLNAFWPKLKCGGIFAGHDYVTQPDLIAFGSKQNWTVNYDGTVDKTGLVVKGAVDEFAKEKQRQVIVSYRQLFWNSW